MRVTVNFDITGPSEKVVKEEFERVMEKACDDLMGDCRVESCDLVNILIKPKKPCDHVFEHGFDTVVTCEKCKKVFPFSNKIPSLGN